MFAVAPSAQDSIAVTSSALVAKCSTIWNPIIYVATNSQFRTAFLNLMSGKRFWRHDNTSQSQSHTGGVTGGNNVAIISNGQTAAGNNGATTSTAATTNNIVTNISKMDNASQQTEMW